MRVAIQYTAAQATVLQSGGEPISVPNRMPASDQIGSMEAS